MLVSLAGAVQCRTSHMYKRNEHKQEPLEKLSLEFDAIFKEVTIFLKPYTMRNIHSCLSQHGGRQRRFRFDTSIVSICVPPTSVGLTRRTAHAQQQLVNTCGIMPKQRSSRGSAPRHAALADQIIQDGAVRVTNRSKKRGQGDEDSQDESYVDEKLSRKILEQARLQQEELEAEHGPGRQVAKQKTTVLGMA